MAGFGAPSRRRGVEKSSRKKRKNEFLKSWDMEYNRHGRIKGKVCRMRERESKEMKGAVAYGFQTRRGHNFFPQF